MHCVWHAAAQASSGLRDIATKNGARFFSTKCKTGSKRAWGGRHPSNFGVETVHDLPGEVHGGGMPLAAFGARVWPVMI